ncbi:MAG: phosphodiester glycosidase family protein [Oscillospiraceae bacterium]|nr:phosphodiester glycosidase family protein [Oscillospiraceae bacterium]
MGYKPKYAQQNVKRNTVVRQTPQKPAPKKKMSRGAFILFVILGIVIVPLSTFASGKILQTMSRNIGRPKAAVVKSAQELALQDQVADFVNGELANVREVLIHGEKPVIDELEEAVEKKIYWIEEDAQVAPEPNQAYFGRAYAPDDYQAILERARLILDGQKTYFQPDQQLYADSVVRYYLDESMFAVTWQEVHDDSVYTFSEIKVNHPSQFRRHLAGGEYGSDMQYLTTEMAEAVNAVVASAGDFYRFRDFGAVVYQGEAKRVEGTYAETCYIDKNGDMHFTYGGDVLTVEDVQKFVDEHEIQFSLAFGPILVDNYQLVPHDWYGVGEITEGYARAALLQMDTLHYIVVTANTTGPHQEIPTVAQFAKNVAATGCKMAYSLDGGQTATIVMNDELINRPVYGQQRKISDIIYFATAVPDGGGNNG